MKHNTHANALLNHMGRGNTITRLEALYGFHIQNVTARIAELRKAGIHVQAKMKRDPNGARYAQYFITAGEIAELTRVGKITNIEGKYELV